MVEPAIVRRPGRGLDRRAGGHQPLFQRQRGDEGLHGRTRLETVGERAVAQLRSREVLPVGGRVARVVGQRQHFAGLHVQHHDAAGPGLVLGDRVAQLLVREELHLAVDRQLQVPARHRRHLLAHVFHDAAEAVLDDAARTRPAGEVLVERELHALLAVVLPRW
jgi:hypothetical protein